MLVPIRSYALRKRSHRKQIDGAGRNSLANHHGELEYHEMHETLDSDKFTAGFVARKGSGSSSVLVAVTRNYRDATVSIGGAKLVESGLNGLIQEGRCVCKLQNTAGRNCSGRASLLCRKQATRSTLATLQESYLRKTKYSLENGQDCTERSGITVSYVQQASIRSWNSAPSASKSHCGHPYS